MCIRDKLRLNDTIGKYIPDIDDQQAKKVTIQQLLTHTSGYAPDFDLKEKWTGREGMLAALKKEKLPNPPGTKFVYSDIGFIVLGEIIRRSTDLDPSLFVTNSLIRPLLNIESSGFRGSSPLLLSILNNLQGDSAKGRNVALKPKEYFAPTENVRGQNSYLGSNFEGNQQTGEEILRGKVHDPTAFRMDGVAGHAGLFSTADDLARYSQ